ncbi:hypothetical protein AB0I84_36995 [Streptomyces spectabilis]|uniref:hypothetical protein n=1 Tax=Streptomyces spectabilis TaxID=68270 RepID=UPI0033FF4B97
MKIAVNLTVELPDPKAWAFEHGLGTERGTAAAVRDDPRKMILNAVQARIPLLNEAGAEISLRE